MPARVAPDGRAVTVGLGTGLQGAWVVVSEERACSDVAEGVGGFKWP